MEVYNMMLIDDGMKIKNQEFLKRENGSLVLQIIVDQGPISRAEIVKQTSMSPTSASRIVGSLQRDGLIREIHLSTDGVGRQATFFEPNENTIIFIGVEIDLHQIQIGLMNFVGNFITRKQLGYSIDTLEETIAYLNSHLEKIIAEETYDDQQIFHEEGVVKLSAQLEWADVRLKELAEQDTGLSVYVDNELKLKAFAKYMGAGKNKTNNMVLLWSPVKDNIHIRMTTYESQGVVMGAAMSVRRQFIKSLHIPDREVK